MANITAREGPSGTSYLITVSAGRDTKGKQIRRTMTWKPEPGMTKKQTEKAVQKAALEFEAKVQNGGIGEQSNIRMADFVDDYLRLKETTVSPTTMQCSRRIIRDLIIPAFGNMKLRDIRPIHVQRWIDQLQQPGMRVDGRGKYLSASTIQRYLTVLKSIMALAYKLQIIESNPTDTARLTLPKVDEEEVQVFDQEELANLFECLEEEPLMWQCLIDLAIVTGARRGELCGLQWTDIDFAGHTVSIRRSNYQCTGEEVKSKAPKTKASARTVSVDDYTIDLLRQWKRDQALLRLSLGDQWQGQEPWLFITAEGGPMYPSTPTLWFDRFQKRHNIPHRKFHALRHTSGTILLAEGSNLKTVAHRLGHTQLSTTNRYLHALEEQDKAAAQTFGNFRKSPEKEVKIS